MFLLNLFKINDLIDELHELKTFVMRDMMNNVIRNNAKLEALMLDFNELQAAIAENSDAVNSAIALITALVDEIRAAGGNQDEINALADKIEASAEALAAAVAANTPASPVIEAPVVVDPVVDAPVDPVVE